MSVFPSWVDNLPILSNGFRWMPGVPGGIPAGTLDTTLTSGQMTASGINNALVAASGRGSPSNIRVVQMPAGDFTISGDIVPQNYTILRGAGPWGAGRTRLLLGTGNCIFSGWSGSDWGPAVNISGSLPVGTTSCTVESATSFAVGDIVQIDQVDDLSYVYAYDHVYHKRHPGDATDGPASPSGLRCVHSLHVVTQVNGTTVTFDPPTRIAYDATFTPQMFRTSRRGTNGLWYSGLESFCLTGPHTDPGAIALLSGAYNWLKDLELDGSVTTGTGISADKICFMHQFRCEIRRCYVHHSNGSPNGFQYGGANYGINLNDSTSETLVIDSISIRMNKPAQGNAPGPGNVWAYCYFDDASAEEDGSWMEGGLNVAHSAFAFAQLVEGCVSCSLASDTTHGNSGFNVFMRNHGLGTSTHINNTGNRRAANLDAWGGVTAFVGNVLMSPSSGPTYSQGGTDNGLCIFSVGQGGPNDFGDNEWNNSQPFLNPADNRQSQAPKAVTTIHRHRNFYKVNATTGAIDAQAGFSDTSVPDSLFLPERPSFFGSNSWPPVNPTDATVSSPLNGRVVPAQARYEAGTPFAAPESGTTAVSATIALTAGEHVVRVRVASGSTATLAPLEVTAATAALAGAVAGAGSVVGAVTHAVPLAAQAAGAGAAMAEFLGLSGLAGVLAGLGTPAAGLALAKLLTGTAASQATATGAATNTRWVAGAAAGATDLTAGLSVGTGMMGAFQGTATPGADLALTKPLGAGAAGAASPAAALALVKALVGTAAGAVSLTGLITGAGELIGWGMAGASSAEGALSVTVNLVSSPTWARALGIADLSGGSSLSPYTLTGVIVAAGLPGFVVPATHAPVTLEG